MTDEQYWNNVEKYEPWALDDDDGAVPTSVLDHMRAL